VVEIAPGVFKLAFQVQAMSAAVIGVPSLHTASGLRSTVSVMAESTAASVVVVSPLTALVVVSSGAPVVVVLSVSPAQAATTSANTNNKRSHRGRLLILFIDFLPAFN
jgi:hypothetical protein